jgi:transcriptional regulator NrdR family protein
METTKDPDSRPSDELQVLRSRRRCIFCLREFPTRQLTPIRIKTAVQYECDECHRKEVNQ